MCGIIGYTGKGEATDKVILGLEVLEYRGYDSVGICGQGQDFSVVKVKGRVKDLKVALLEKSLPKTGTAIGHTRWATHGSPSDKNAHPHIVGDVCLVHNGIIENYKELKADLLEKGYSFLSETDTEVAAGVIDYCVKQDKDTKKGILHGTSLLGGSYAFAIMVKGERDTVYAIRRGSPLVIGLGEDGCFLASDITALLPFTKVYYPLKEGELITLTPTGAELDGNSIEWQETELTYEAAQKGGYEHFMLKEIYEQPSAIKSALSPRIRDGLPCFTTDGIDKELLKSVGEIHIVACGSAMHSALAVRSFLEAVAGVITRVFVASEYRYSPPLMGKDTLVVIVSQSGETADSLASLRYAKGQGLKTVAIVNVVESSIAREADFRVYTYAGPEIAVATTKGYTTQLATLYLLGVAMGLEKGRIDREKAKSLTECLFFDTQRVCEAVLGRREEIRKIANEIYKRDNIFYIGRGVDYALCQEASLKLKEISYIHCEAYAAGELKHGTISLIEKGTPVIAIATEKRLYDKLDSNVKEVKSRGAYTVLIGSELTSGADSIFNLPRVNQISEIFGAVTVTQLLAYEVACLRGCDIDKPRNLAKSVTVE